METKLWVVLLGLCIQLVGCATPTSSVLKRNSPSQEDVSFRCRLEATPSQKAIIANGLGVQTTSVPGAFIPSLYAKCMKAAGYGVPSIDYNLKH